jgi:hypothetical protein
MPSLAMFESQDLTRQVMYAVAAIGATGYGLRMNSKLNVIIREIKYADGIGLRSDVLNPNPAKVAAGLV